MSKVCGVRLIIDPINQGFCSALDLKCTLCTSDEYHKSVYTSTRIHNETRGDVAFDVNVRMVLLAQELGLGYAALRKISTVLGIPGLHLKTYQKHNKRVTGMERGLRRRNQSVSSLAVFIIEKELDGNNDPPQNNKMTLYSVAFSFSILSISWFIGYYG